MIGTSEEAIQSSFQNQVTVSDIHYAFLSSASEDVYFEAP